MKLLLTGGTGFIGHHIVEHLLKNTDWQIVIIDRLSYAASLERLVDIDIWEREKYRVKFVWHDLRSSVSDTISNIIGSVDYIWHLAAESHVDRSLVDSIPFIMSNVVGTANLLEYARKLSGLRRFIYFSTDEVFGPAPQGVFYKEGDVCNPSNPYAASKEGAEAIAKSFAFSFGLPVTITRTMNVFGERQHPEKFLPKTIRSILNGDVILIHGLPKSVSSRCWIHARNIGSALIYITNNGEFISKKLQDDRQNGIYHIVGEERSVLDLANRVSMIINNRELGDNEIEYVNFHSTRPGHDLRYALSGSKLEDSGFKYSVDLDSSFERTVKWMVSPENRRWLFL